MLGFGFSDKPVSITVVMTSSVCSTHYYLFMSYWNVMSWTFYTQREIDYTVMEQATIHELLLQHLGITKVHILAHDLGDTVALELLAR